MTKILHKRGSGEPDAGSLDVGEIALDTSTGTAYTKLSNGTVVEIGGSGGDSTGAGMVISKTEPVDKVDGMQWLEADTGLVFIWDEDKWLQFPAGSEGGGSSGGGGGTSYPFTADGDISAGDPVYLKKSGRVEKSTIRASSLGGKDTLSATSKHISICCDTAQEKFVVFYLDSDDGNKGKAMVGTFANGQMSYGSPVVFADYALYQGQGHHISSAYDENRGQVVVCCTDSASGFGRIVAGTVSGDSISFGNELDVGSYSYGSGICYDPTVDKLIYHQRRVAEEELWVHVVENNGSDLAIIKSYQHIASWQRPQENSVVVVHLTDFPLVGANALGYTYGNKAYIRPILIDPDTFDIKAGFEYNVVNPSGQGGKMWGNQPMAWSAEHQRLFVLYEMGYSGPAYMACTTHRLKGSNPQTDLQFERRDHQQLNSQTGYEGYQGFPSMVISRDGLHGAAIWPDQPNSGKCVCRFLTSLEDGRTNFSVQITVDDANTGYTSATYTSSGNNFILAYSLSNDAGAKYAIGNSAAYDNTASVIGFASSDASAGDTVKVDMIGCVNSHQSDLVPNTEYRLDTQNGFSLLPWAAVHNEHTRVGFALSKDSILVMARSAQTPTWSREAVKEKLSEAQTMDISEGEE